MKKLFRNFTAWFARVILRRKPRLVYHKAELRFATLPDVHKRYVAIIYKHN